MAMTKAMQYSARKGLMNRIDGKLLLLALSLLVIGFLSMTSASIDYADHKFGQPLFHAYRYLFHLSLGLSGAIVIYLIPMRFWLETGWIWLFLSLFMLILVLIPGIGREVNGSRRWLALGPLTLQCSEFAKMFVIIYLAGYLVRREAEVRSEWQGFIKPMAVLFGITILLMLEPDFGATVVTIGTAFGMLFLAGVRIGHFLCVVGGSFAALVVLIVSEPYRMARLAAYADPWDDKFNSGYQLTQSLIAFGRGEWFGVGLGNSVQKLFYLPEAHTDFVFSIWAEEMGLFGAVLVITLYALLVSRLLWVARKAWYKADHFGHHVASGIALLFAGQVFINIGVATGLLPTKGLTLPFLSYGGSSLIVSCLLIALVLRIDKECGLRGNNYSG